VAGKVLSESFVTAIGTFIILIYLQASIEHRSSITVSYKWLFTVDMRLAYSAEAAPSAG
jgi:hypothetical protein